MQTLYEIGIHGSANLASMPNLKDVSYEIYMKKKKKFFNSQQAITNKQKTRTFILIKHGRQ